MKDTYNSEDFSNNELTFQLGLSALTLNKQVQMARRIFLKFSMKIRLSWFWGDFMNSSFTSLHAYFFFHFAF